MKKNSFSNTSARSGLNAAYINALPCLAKVFRPSFVGILAGVPVFAVIYDLARRWIVAGLRKHGKTDVLQ